MFYSSESWAVEELDFWLLDCNDVRMLRSISSVILKERESSDELRRYLVKGNQRWCGY